MTKPLQPTGETHCAGFVVYRFVVREGPPSHGGAAARAGTGSRYDKCMGCGEVLRTFPPDRSDRSTPA